ncbi:hypothetical protein MSPP1_000410 [Malassezia sp. CBS 17886]|nr:hypothetical protein MSPP1_000410 [Malassezia sp. CBS 17886]
MRRPGEDAAGSSPRASPLVGQSPQIPRTSTSAVDSVPASAAAARAAYTRPAPQGSQYTSPIVTVTQGGGARPPPRPPFLVSRSPAPGASHETPPPTRPPFIISNSLAAVSGLGTPPGSRARVPLGAGASPTGPAASAATAAAAGRLPPHKDLVEDDAELAAQRAATKARMSARLAEDHTRCLAPDTTAFRSAEDVVARLLPYHIWQVPEQDLLTAMDGTLRDRDTVCAGDEDAHMSYAVPYGAPAQKKMRPHKKDTPSSLLALPPFPTIDYTLSVYERRARLQRRYAALQTRANTSFARAPQESTSHEQLERLVYEDEMRVFQELSNELRRARAELEERERQRTWRPSGWNAGAGATAYGVGQAYGIAGGHGTGAGYSGPGYAGISSAYGGSPPVARPYAVGGSARPPAPVVASNTAALTQAVVSHLAGLSGEGANARDGAESAAGAASSATSSAPLRLDLPSLTAGAGPSIPTQPLPLVVPITAVPRLTALGIHLVPASHLIPALSLASAGQSVAINPSLTAPRPVVGVQTEAVLLVGITEAPAPSPPATPVSRQRLHLSVILSRLRPEQLSGLATLMQTLQAEDEQRAASSTPSAAN